METRCISMERINKGTRGAVNARGSRHKTRPQSINARAVRICRPPHNIYEPLLGENRELGEIPDSTLITNPRLI